MATKGLSGPVSTGTTDYDVVIVGAGYPGLIAGAILARNGVKTILVEELDQIGGRGGSVYNNGWWIDLGPRDANDTGEVYLTVCAKAQYAMKAAKAAGADVSFVGPVEPLLTAHLAPEGKKIVPLRAGPEGVKYFMKEVFDLSPALSDKFLAKVGSLVLEDPKKLITTTLKDWLPSIEKGLHKPFLTMSGMMHPLPPEETSVGRLIQYFQDPTTIYLSNDPEIGGLQGFMEPYARVIRKHGGRIELGAKPFEILVEGGKVQGVVTRDKCSTIQVFRAPTVLFTGPIWTLFDILNEKLMPRKLVRDAKKLHSYSGDIMAINIGLSGLPIIDATGKPDTYTGFNRIFKNRGFYGGFWIPTLISKKQAPPGKHLLVSNLPTYGPGYKEGWEPYTSFREAKAKADYQLDYMKHYYRDLDRMTEWMTYNLVKRPTIDTLWVPVDRAPLEAPGVKGLFFVSDSTEVEGQEHDIAANAALQATDRILKARARRS